VRRVVTTKETDGIQFEAMDLADVERVSVVPQTLDNQWVPKPMLGQMLAKGQDLGDVERQRTKLVRAEYVRSLINARQVIVNRAYLYNNAVVFTDYVKPGEGREAFKDLLRSGVVVVFLFSEESPNDEPGFTTDPRGFTAWREVTMSVPVRCLRLSWDDDLNREMIREQLRKRFHVAAQDAVTSDASALARDLGIPSESAGALLSRLGDVARHCVDQAVAGKLATREELYQEFVVADRTPPAEGKYDGSKAFASEIKQLLDLSYNVNLPDAVGGYALTPVDSLPRTALQEWRKSQEKKEVSADELVDLLRRTAFDLIQGGLYMRSFGTLRLHDVQEIRLTDEWSKYIQSLDGLLADPLSFADPDTGIARIYRDYTDVAKVATSIGVAGRSKRLTARWDPVVELVIEVAGAALSVVWGGGIVFKIAGVISSKVLGKGAPVVARLVVRGLTERGSRAELAMSCDFMRSQLTDARNEWDMLVSKLRETPGWVEAREEVERSRAATISYPEEAYV
jgi:hypothetical protein